MLRGWPSAKHASVSRFNPLNPERILWLRKRRRRKRRRRRRRPRSPRSEFSARVERSAPPGHPIGECDFRNGGPRARLFDSWLTARDCSALREAPAWRRARQSRRQSSRRSQVITFGPGDDAVADAGREQAVDHEHRKGHRHEDAAQFQHPRQGMRLVGGDELRQEGEEEDRQFRIEDVDQESPVTMTRRLERPAAGRRDRSRARRSRATPARPCRADRPRRTISAPRTPARWCAAPRQARAWRPACAARSRACSRRRPRRSAAAPWVSATASV